MGTLVVLALCTTDNLQVWHFCVVNTVIGLGNAIQWPVYSAAITMMVPKNQLSRANGLMTSIQADPGIVAPLLAGALLPVIGLIGILLTDIATFVLAIGVLFLVYVPQPPRTIEASAGKGNLIHEATFGIKYIFARPSLLGYVKLLFLGFPNAVEVPMILLRTNNSSIILGVVQTSGAASWTIGSFLMATWRGPKKRMHGALLGWVVYCLFGNILFGLGTSLGVWTPAILAAGVGRSVGIATSQTILQVKVAPDVQGYIFSARRMLTWFPDTFTPILGGMLADYVMEPVMRKETWFSQMFDWLVGKESGSGMALIMIMFGVLTIITLLSGFIIPKIRNLEEILPDHDQLELVDEPE